MYGLIGHYGDCEPHALFSVPYNYAQESLKSNEYTHSDYHIIQKTINMYTDDKLFYETQRCHIAVEGVIYSIHGVDLCSSLAEKIEWLFINRKQSIGQYINGNYCIVIYDKVTHSLYLYANHTAFKSIYYYVNKSGGIFFSTDYSWLVNSMKNSGESIKLSKIGAVCLLSHGFMLDKYTLINGVYKLLPGYFIEVKPNSFIEQEYFNYCEIAESNDSYDSLLNTANNLFGQAVDRIYKKDDEYRLKHICTLSGGLDSRSSAFVGKELGYDQLFITMSQHGLPDEVISTLIASDLKSEHLVYHLDDSDFLLDVKDAIYGNGGTITYPGFAHMYSFFSHLNLQKYGAICTGELGDLVFGGGKSHYANMEADANIGKLISVNSIYDYVDREELRKITERSNNAFNYFLINRGLNSAVNGWYSSYYFTESASPFLDFDFIKFILSVPHKYKDKSKFYIDWMERYQPDMLKYNWAATLTRPDASELKKQIVHLGMSCLLQYQIGLTSLNCFTLMIY